MKRELPDELISAYLDGQLTAAQQAEVEAALAEVVNVLVAREFFVERIEESVIVSGYKLYASPHWVSLHGSFFIEWLPEVTTIEVIVVGAGETLEDAE